MDERDPITAFAVQGYYFGKGKLYDGIAYTAQRADRFIGTVRAKVDL